MSDSEHSDPTPRDEPEPTRMYGAIDNGATPVRKSQTEQPQTIRVGTRQEPGNPSSQGHPPTSRRSTASFDWTPPEAEELARLLPQYQIDRILGRGGMAVVYQGLQIELDRPVAIKLLPAEMAADQEFVDRFRREARILAKLQHPGIVAVYDFGLTSEGHLFFVMEFVDGTDLHKIVRGPGLDPSQALELICQICDALNYAHRQGVIHRDIKPSNILVSSFGNTKLADFGLARPLHDDFSGLTATHAVMGTLDYMAPEQHDGVADHRSDIFSLGAMFYEMLTGKPPRGIFDPPSRKSKVDVRIDEVVHKALQYDVERRYQDVSELRTDVDRIRTTPPEPIAEELPPPAPPVPRPRWGKKLAIPALVLVPLLGLGAFFISGSGKTLFHSGQTESTPSPVQNAAPAPQPDPAVVEQERQAKEEARRQEEEESKRKEEAQRRLDEERERQAKIANEERQLKEKIAEEERQKQAKIADEEHQRQVKLDANTDALRKSETLEAPQLLSAALAGDPAAQSLLALLQREGYKTRKDPAAALRWAGLAADKGNPVGQAALAFLDWGDDGLKADREQSAKLAAGAIPALKALAGKNEPAACYALGRIYALGIGVPKDPAAAVALYKPASLQDFGLAQNALAYMYETGDGVEKDPAQARALFDSAATAYLLTRETVQTPGGIVGLEPGTPVVIVSQKNGMVTVKSRNNYQLDVAENNLSRNAKTAQALLEQNSAAQRAYKEKAAADLAAQKRQQELAVQKAQAAYGTPTPSRPLSPQEQLASLREQERQIGVQLSDTSAQLSQIRVVGSARTSPNAAAAINARKGLSDELAALNRQLRDLRNQEAQIRASLNAAPRNGAAPGTSLRGASLQPARGL